MTLEPKPLLSPANEEQHLVYGEWGQPSPAGGRWSGAGPRPGSGAIASAEVWVNWDTLRGRLRVGVSGALGSE